MTVLQWFSVFHLLSSRVRCTINRSQKGRIRASANFSRTLLGLFSACEWQDMSFTYQKSEKTTYLDNLVFSAFSVLWGTVKNPGRNPTGVIRYLGSASGSLWQNSPHKDAFFCISLTNISNVESHVHLKSNKAPIYAIKGPETASAKFLNVLFSWATKPEDCNCVLTS